MTINSITTTYAQNVSQSVFPFHLTSLTLGRGFNSPTLAIALISTSSQTLRHLDLFSIYLYPGGERSYLRVPLPPDLSTPELRTLRYNYYCTNIVLLLLPTCAHLEDLETAVASPRLEELGPMLAAVRTPIASLKLPHLDERDEDAIILLLRALENEEGGPLSQLKTLGIGMEKDTLEGLAGGRALLETLESRGIEVVVMTSEDLDRSHEGGQ